MCGFVCVWYVYGGNVGVSVCVRVSVWSLWYVCVCVCVCDVGVCVCVCGVNVCDECVCVSVFLCL